MKVIFMEHGLWGFTQEQSDRWKEAMKCKYSSLIKNGMWELVPPPEGKNFVGSPWVLKVKHNDDGSMDRFEARLVAQGYSQVEGVDYEEVFSPVAHYGDTVYYSVRSLLALANAHNLEIQSVHQINGCKTAFLYDSLDWENYMSQTEGFADPVRPNHVCKLKKGINFMDL